ncbi:hypothetical protein D3C85_1307150 [compost metagenome]
MYDFREVRGVLSSWLTKLTNSSFFLSACFLSVMSLAIFESPTTSPARFLIGDIVSDTLIRVPSFLRRSVSKWSTRMPWRNWANILGSSSKRSGGIIFKIDSPIISLAS